MVDEQIFTLLDNGMNELGWETEREDLRVCRERYKAGMYFVAFIGQYSAGKSYLINNLLERDLLPQGTVETTPLLTYIRYGAEEKAHLYHLDGRVEEVSLAEVCQIIQNGSDCSRDLAAVEHMEVFLSAEILQQGLILLDTPGVNTLIEHHEHLLMQSLALASSIIYVTRGTPSAVDIDKLELLAHGGRPLTLVRTHCDQINEAEESYAEVVAHEEHILTDLGIREHLEESFYISNLANSPHFGEIARIRDLLAAKGADVRRSLAEDTALGLRVVTNEVMAALEAQEKMLAAGQEERAAAIRKSREQLDHEVAALAASLDEHRMRLQKEMAACQKRMELDVHTFIEIAADEAAVRIAGAGKEVQTNEQMKSLLQRETQRILRRTYDRINAHLDPVLKDINSVALPSGTILPVIALPEAEHYATIVEEQDSTLDALRRQYAHLQENRAELESRLVQVDDSEREEIERAIAQLQQEIAAAGEEYSELGSYVPQMIEVDPGKASGAAMGKMIGNVLDWATLLIPSGAVAKLATNPTVVKFVAKMPTVLGKYGNVIAKGLKEGQSIAKAVSNIQNVSRTYATAKRVAKAKKQIDQAIKVINVAKEAMPASFLERLTLEYWGEQIGKQFDHPPRYEEDLAFRAEYEENKHRLEQEIRRKQEELYQRKRKLGAFKNEQEQKAALRDSLVVNEQELERQIAAQEQQWREDAKRKSLREWKRACADSYRDHLKSYLTQVTNDYMGETSTRLETYQVQRLLPLEEKIKEKQKEYDRLEALSQGEADEKRGCVSRILAELQQVVGA